MSMFEKARETALEYLGKKLVKPVATAPEALGEAYFAARQATPLTGGTNLKAVTENLPEFQNILRSEAEPILAGLPTREEFNSIYVPLLEKHGKIFGSGPGSAGIKEGAAARVDYAPDARMAGIGFEAPGGIQRRSGAKGKIDIDAQVVEMIAKKNFEGASNTLYDQLRNVARATPESMVDVARQQGSVFYPIRALRNAAMADRLGVDQRFIDILTSINSANAGPIIEQRRTMAILPFLQMKGGKVTFDKAGATKVFGKGFLSSPGVSQVIKGIEDGSLLNPDFVNTPIAGLKGKTRPYAILAMDPKSVIAMVADTIDAGTRSGRAALLPSANSVQQAVLGQMPTRILAHTLGIQNAAAQEISWFVTRILRGESSSAAPFDNVPSASALDAALSGERVLGNPNASTIPRQDLFSDNLRKYLQRRGGGPGLVHNEVQGFLGGIYKAFDDDVARALEKQAQGVDLTDAEARVATSYEILNGNVIPNRENIATLFPPELLAKNPDLVGSVADAFSAIQSMPRARAQTTAKHLMALISLLGTTAALGAAIPQREAQDRMRGGKK